MRAVLVVVGAVVGLLIVRSFFFDTAEEVAWRLFWEALFRGHIGVEDLDRVSGTATFTKSMIGLGVGAVAGFLAAGKIKIKKGKRRLFS